MSVYPGAYSCQYAEMATVAYGPPPSHWEFPK